MFTLENHLFEQSWTSPGTVLAFCDPGIFRFWRHL